MERSDRRRPAYPEMVVYEGESIATHTTQKPSSRHEWVCGPTTLERSDWRRLAYPEMAVCEGEFKATPSKIADQEGKFSAINPAPPTPLP